MAQDLQSRIKEEFYKLHTKVLSNHDNYKEILNDYNNDLNNLEMYIADRVEREGVGYQNYESDVTNLQIKDQAYRQTYLSITGETKMPWEMAVDEQINKQLKTKEKIDFVMSALNITRHCLQNYINRMPISQHILEHKTKEDKKAPLEKMIAKSWKDLKITVAPGLAVPVMAQEPEKQFLAANRESVFLDKADTKLNIKDTAQNLYQILQNSPSVKELSIYYDSSEIAQLPDIILDKLESVKCFCIVYLTNAERHPDQEYQLLADYKRKNAVKINFNEIDSNPHLDPNFIIKNSEWFLEHAPNLNKETVANFENIIQKAKIKLTKDHASSNHGRSF